METIGIRELEAARALAKSGSLAAAARELHRTPAAVHKQLKQLEFALGTPLYEKTGRGIRLLGAMDALIPYAESVLSQILAARRAVEEWRGLRSGIVRVGTGPTLSVHCLPGMVNAFHARAPEIQVTVDTGSSDELQEQLRRGQLDLALMIHEGRKGSAEWVALGGWEASLVIASATRALRATRRLKDLEGEPFFAFRTGARLTVHIERYFARHDHAPETVVRCDNADAIRAMLRQRRGYSVLPGWTLAGEHGPGQVRAIDLAEKLPPFRIELVASKNHPLPPAARAFAEVARKFRLE
jgi:DNA-binding transcriptional LysR family regulator